MLLICSRRVHIMCDNEQQATANCYENSVTYVCVKSNSSCHKVSISYTTQNVGTVRSVTFSQTVTNAHVFSHSVQSYCAVSCVKRCKCTNGTQTDCGFTVTVVTSLDTQPSKIVRRQGLKLQLEWELSRTLKLVMEPELISEMCVDLNQLTLLSACDVSIVSYLGWPQRG